MILIDGGYAPPPPARSLFTYHAEPSQYPPQHPAWVEKVRECIMHRESRGDYTIRSYTTDPNGNYAYGAYQFQDGTWHAVTGLPGHASDYPPAVQDAAFFKKFDNGKGRMAWNFPSDQCW